MHKKVKKTIIRSIKKDITLNVPQGIGDIFWIYQKFAPYFDVINFNILIIESSAVQKRARNFLELLPKCGSVNFKLVSPNEYTKNVLSKPKLSSIIVRYSQTNKEFNYCCNTWLESGIRLEDIDKQFPIETNVDIRSESCMLPHEKYIILYVCGHKSKLVWTDDNWIDFMKMLYEKHEINLPVYVIGASYDKDMVLNIHNKLIQNNFTSHHYVDFPISNIIHMIRNAELFIGYQSGLNIIADNFDTPQIMLYYDSLKAMTDTWVKPQNIESKIFKAFYFSQPPKEIIENLKNNLSFKSINKS